MKQWFFQHQLSLSTAVDYFKRIPLTSTVTLLILVVALFLPTALWVAMSNMKGLDHAWDSGTGITAILKDQIDSTSVKQLVSDISQESFVKTVRFISAEEGLTVFAESSAFNDLIKGLKTNPLPDLIEIQLKTSVQTGEQQQLIAQLKSSELTSAVSFDQQWIERFQAMVNLLEHLLLVLVALISMATLLLMGNGIYLATHHCCEDIEVLKLLGAPHCFIRRPFLYLGILIGLLSAGLTWLLTESVIGSLSLPIQQLTILYHTDYQLQGLGAEGGLVLLILGGMIGYLGALLAARSHLIDSA